MEQKRALVVQDISCVGKCSMTIAMPVLAAFGHETCILPTALLSTHTGGFGKPAIIQLGDALEPFWQHWMEQGIQFDGILTGYLGSTAAVEAAMDIVERLLAPGGVCVVDPAMADHGKLYSGLDEEYARAMAALCRRADIILPNLTEAKLLAGISQEKPVELLDLMEQLNFSCPIVTGVEQDDKIAVLLKTGGQVREYAHPRLKRNFHGTGDLFAACLMGSLLRKEPLWDAVQLACHITVESIKATMEAADPRFGLRFERVLPLIEWGAE